MAHVDNRSHIVSIRPIKTDHPVYTSNHAERAKEWTIRYGTIEEFNVD